MVRKRLDDRIRHLLERSVATGQRSMLLLVGDHGRDQVPTLHQILTKLQSLQQSRNSSITWCYKKELGFSTHRMKRLKKLKRDKARGLLGGDNSSTADNFELFISQNDINWCYYKDSHRLLGTTVNLLVLQDFEALTPNLMARTIETVRGGGLIVFLLKTVTSLQQLYALTMDVHARYRTQSAADVVPRFNERFLLSLARTNPNCLVCDDELNVLPLSRRALRGLSKAHSPQGDDTATPPETASDAELRELQESLADTPHVGAIVALTKTLDQARAVLTFLEACSDHTSSSTHAASANRQQPDSDAGGRIDGRPRTGQIGRAGPLPGGRRLAGLLDRGRHGAGTREPGGRFRLCAARIAGAAVSGAPGLHGAVQQQQQQ